MMVQEDGVSDSDLMFLASDNQLPVAEAARIALESRGHATEQPPANEQVDNIWNEDEW